MGLGHGNKRGPIHSCRICASFANEIRIFENATLVALRAPLEGRDKTRVDPAHRRPLTRSHRRPSDGEPIGIRRAGDQVARRSLDFYQAVAQRIAGQRGAP